MRWKSNGNVLSFLHSFPCFLPYHFPPSKLISDRATVDEKETFFAFSLSAPSFWLRKKLWAWYAPRDMGAPEMNGTRDCYIRKKERWMHEVEKKTALWGHFCLGAAADIDMPFSKQNDVSEKRAKTRTRAFCLTKGPKKVAVFSQKDREDRRYNSRAVTSGRLIAKERKLIKSSEGKASFFVPFCRSLGKKKWRARRNFFFTREGKYWFFRRMTELKKKSYSGSSVFLLVFLLLFSINGKSRQEKLVFMLMTDRQSEGKERH